MPSVAIEDAIVELMQRAKIEAIKRQTSFEALVAEGLRAMLARQKEEALRGNGRVYQKPGSRYWHVE